MPGFLRQATAAQVRSLGPFVDDTDFKTAETGLTIANTDIKLIINGAASVDKNSGGGTHRANGNYGVTFDATDTATVGEMQVSVLATGALQVFDKFFVIEEAVYDALFAASAVGYASQASVNTIDDFLDTEIATILTNIDTIDNFVDTEIATIITNLSTIDDFLDTEVAAILAAVDTEVAAIKAKTDLLAFTGGGIDANVISLVASTQAAANLRDSATVIYIGTVTGAATTTTLIDSGLTQADTDHWKGRIVIFLTGTLKYQATDITGFDPALDQLTFTALTQAPAGSDTYVVL